MGMKYLHAMAQFLGQGKRWQVGNVVIYLWPFVALAIFAALLVVYDVFLA